jgi:hypothetical protein
VRGAGGFNSAASEQVMLREVIMGLSAILLFVVIIMPVPSDAAEPSHRHESGVSCSGVQPDSSGAERFEGIQLETSNITAHEQLFETVLKAQTVFKVDHPQVDHLRGYCFRDMLIVIRQDLKTPRPTGWVQVNFAVPDVEKIKAVLEANLSQGTSSVARLKLKPDVPRSNCRVTRLEVFGPEGFMIGFDQVKPETCQTQRKEMSP